MEIELPENARYREVAKRLEHHVDEDGNYRYILECKRPNQPPAILRRRAKQFSLYDSVPVWMDDALAAHTLVYVGQTSNPSSRLTSHVQGNERAALFTRLFPPSVLRELKGFESRFEAEASEQTLRQRLNRMFRDDRFFAYSDLGDGEAWNGSLRDDDAVSG